MTNILLIIWMFFEKARQDKLFLFTSRLSFLTEMETIGGQVGEVRVSLWRRGKCIIQYKRLKDDGKII